MVINTGQLNKVIPFQLTASDAEKASRLPELMKHNLNILPEEVTPFTVGIMKIYPEWSKSRFNLPLLCFRGEPVAAMGFRNKDGFILTRQGLPKQVEMAVVSRMTSITDTVKRSLRALDEERKHLDVTVDDILSAHGEPKEIKIEDLNKGAFSVPMAPSQLYNRFSLSLTGAELKHGNAKHYRFIVRNRQFNLERNVVSVNGVHNHSRVYMDVGKESLVRRNIMAGEALMKGHINKDEFREEVRRAEPMTHSDMYRMWEILPQAMKNANNSPPSGPYTVDPNLLGGCLMRDGIIVAEISRRSLRPSPDAFPLLHHVPNMTMKLSRILFVTAGLVNDPAKAEERTMKTLQEGWERALEDAVLSTDFGYS